MSLEDVTDGERDILEVIWERGSPTSREVTEKLHEKVSDSKQASVQKLLERLETKGYVRRDRRERAHRFEALVSREEYLQIRLRALADQVCGGALAPLLTTLVRSKELTKRNRAELRQLIDDLWPDGK